MQRGQFEALRRIEDARRTQTETLNLGDLALAELPAEVGHLPHLRTLCLGSVKAVGDDPENWQPNGTRAPFTDLTPISGLASLKELDLRSSGVVDLSPLSYLAGLQSLDLGDTWVWDLTPLSGLFCLKSLGLKWTAVTDLSPLSRLLACAPDTRSGLHARGRPDAALRPGQPPETRCGAFRCE
jgi:Leucine-rich repeat (LRR) protein